MHNLQKAGEFTHDLFGSLTTVKNETGDIFFIGKEVAKMLGYQNVSKTLTDHVDEEDKFKLNSESLSSLGITSGQRGEVLISESGLYSLILSSKIEGARAFKKWVTSEVLPDIRKRGLYATPMTVDAMIDNPDMAIELLQAYKKEREARVKAQSTVEMLIHNEKLYTATEIAKELGMRSPQVLNKKLESNGIQYKVNDSWVATAPYAEKNWFSNKQQIRRNEDGSEIVIYDRKITGEGREALLRMLSTNRS